MSTILPHEFRTHVWNLLHAARWKYRMQKWRKKSRSGHRRTSLTGYIFSTKACIDNRKKLVKWQYVLHMSSEYSELQPINGWDLLASLGHSSKFQRFVIAATSLNRSRPTFALCSAVSWPGILYIRFRQLLSPDGILPCAKFTLCPATQYASSHKFVGLCLWN